MKNTQEILGPLAARTGQALIDRYEFLDAGRRIRRTIFSNGISVVVNGSAENFRVVSDLGGEVVLPPHGLLVEADDFAAFVALSWNGRQYPEPVLFTLTSLDGASLSKAGRVRVYHGFGDAGLNWRGEQQQVVREEICGD
ncbi:MAG: hypothetical protein EHM21_03880 [Chloroflexi bacterium]|nr:MAG: hypothetical protein EHM21_03880 [Chloroflexota bacterium]